MAVSEYGPATSRWTIEGPWHSNGMDNTVTKERPNQLLPYERLLRPD